MEYNLKLSQQEIQIISAALGELPLKVSIALFGKIQQQVINIDNEKSIPVENLSIVDSK